jgi:transposase-like protein
LNLSDDGQGLRDLRRYPNAKEAKRMANQEACEADLRRILAKLDAVGAGASRTACLVAMALDQLGDIGGPPKREFFGPTDDVRFL